MRLEATFLRSAVARRVFWVVLAAAALPLAVFAALGYGALSDRLEAVMHGRLQEAAKYAGLRVYDRLVSAQTALAAMAAGTPADQPPGDVPLAARELFRSVVTIDHAGGRVQGSLELAELWRHLSTDQRDGVDGARRRLWWMAGPAGREGRVVVGVRDPARWWLAELAPGFLWGDLRDHDAAVATCVTDARGVVLLCPQGGAGVDPRADARAGVRSVSWSLFTRGDFGTIDWVFTRRAERGHLVVGGFPLEQVAWKAAAFSLLLVVGLSLVLIRRTTVPLERLMDGTRALARRDWSARVEVSGRDEFGQLAGSFNEMAGRIERQVQALQVQSDIDHEILSGLDLQRVLGQVMARVQTLVPQAQVGLLLAPEGPGRWQRVASRMAAAATVAVDPDLLRRVDDGTTTVTGADGRSAARLMGLDEAPAAVRLVPARANGRTRALLMLAGALPDDEDLLRELDDLGDRLAVLLVAAERDRELRARAVIDSLTGLLNRAGLIEAVERRLQAPAEAGFILAFIDLDGFKSVNDARGHPVGDALLVEVAATLRGLAPPDAIIARPGGDEFVLLLPGGERAAADALATAICSRLAEPFVVSGHTLRIGASIGLVCSPDHGRDRVELMRRADLAMYAAKSAGRARHAWFEPAMDQRAAARDWLQSELPGALQRNELRLHYQPRVTANGRRLASVEALVRWPHPVRGMIPPLQFVPLAEETGQIEALGRWVLDAACRQQRRWRLAGVPVPRVAVNVSALQLADPNFADEVLATVQRHGLQPSDLEIELTESLFAGDADEVSARLQPLRQAGVLVALDDFGTGFSSLSSLYRLPVDVMKIDRSFVCDLGQRESADAVARSVVALARALGKHVVAEGVETEDQLQHLLALGCDELQGYLFARPLPADEVVAWIRRETSLA